MGFIATVTAPPVEPGFWSLFAQPIATLLAAAIALAAATLAWRGVRATIAANAVNLHAQLTQQRQIESDRVERELENAHAALRIEAYGAIHTSLTAAIRVLVGYLVLGTLPMSILNIMFGVFRRPLRDLTEIEIRMARAGMTRELEALYPYIALVARAVRPPAMLGLIGLVPPWSGVNAVHYFATRNRLGAAADKAAKSIIGPPGEAAEGAESA